MEYVVSGDMLVREEGKDPRPRTDGEKRREMRAIRAVFNAVGGVTVLKSRPSVLSLLVDIPDMATHCALSRELPEGWSIDRNRKTTRLTHA